MSEQWFGPYIVVQRVAQGSTATVFRARHVELDRFVAIKELSPHVLGVPGMRERLRSEAETLARLADPHVVEIYDYVEDEDGAWIAEQWIDGASLERIMEAHGTLTPEQSVGVVREAVLGLAHAHDFGLVHRDISPGNILADLDGTSRLVDFGLAAPSGEQGTYGTPAFMSPEAASGGSITKPSDVYSAAAVLYTLLAGRPPFPGGDVAATLRAHREAPVPELDGHGADLRALLSRSMSKDPAVRPQDARAFLQELEEAARRRLGATWLQRASIATVVSGVVGVPAALGVTGGVTAAAPTVVVDSASIATGRGATGAPGRTGRGTLALLGAAALVLVGGGVATAVALTGGSEDTPASANAPLRPSPTPSPTPSPSPTEPTLREQVPPAKYRFARTLISSTYDDPGPKRETRTWTVRISKCGSASCKGDIKSSSGSEFGYTWNGSSFQIKLPNGGRTVYEGPCFDDVTGEEVPGTLGRAVTTYTWSPLRPVKVKDGVPVRFEGQQRQQSTYEGLSEGCRDSPSDRARWTMSLSRPR